MDQAIEIMLAKYNCQTTNDYINALKEIIQEIALLGLWRAKFFDKAAFYGGTALRILYKLNRFSEDLDFSLLTPDPHFTLEFYNTAVKKELAAFGFELEVISKPKLPSQIVSAFIKANTKIQLLNLQIPSILSRYLPKDQLIKIKMEIDTDPPGNFDTEARILLQPIPFSVNAYSLPDCFAGKIHAVLHRQWQSRVKGRDWYDFVWFISQNTPVRLSHLKERLVQSEEWDPTVILTEPDLKNRLIQKIDQLNINQAKYDVAPFIKDQDSLALWSPAFFRSMVDEIQTIS